MEIARELVAEVAARRFLAFRSLLIEFGLRKFISFDLSEKSGGKSWENWENLEVGNGEMQ